MQTQDHLVDVPGGQVFVRQWTPGGPAAHRPPLILLHDSLGCVALWRDFPAALAGRLGRPVIAYDRLGFGQSSARQGLPSLAFITEEAELHFPALCRALGITEHALLGHSVGGAMALVAAATGGAGCRAVVTEAAQACVEPRTVAGIRAAQAQFAQPGQFEKLAKWHGEKARWVLDAWTQVWLSPAFAGWSLDPFLGRVPCPVLALHGDEDEYGSVAFPTRIAQGVPGPARMEILERCGHVPHREQPETVLGVVADFLAAV